MKRIKKPFSCLVLALSTLLVMTTATAVFAKPASDLDDLLAQVAAGQIAQNSQNKAREAQFKAKLSEQDQLLVQASKERDEQIDLSNQLEQNFQNNDLALADQSDALNKSLGELKELFGVLQQVAGDTRSKFETSVISAEFEGRGEFLDEFAQSMGSTSKLASIEEIERLWFELQREMTESGKVQPFTREVVIANGTKVNQEITRVGGFNLIADGKYL